MAATMGNGDSGGSAPTTGIGRMAYYGFKSTPAYQGLIGDFMAGQRTPALGTGGAMAMTNNALMGGSTPLYAPKNAWLPSSTITPLQKQQIEDAKKAAMAAASQKWLNTQAGMSSSLPGYTPTGNYSGMTPITVEANIDAGMGGQSAPGFGSMTYDQVWQEMQREAAGDRSGLSLSELAFYGSGG